MIPIANIYFLLCYAWNRLEERDVVNVSTTDCQSLLELFARVLISGMTHILKRGLDRGYVTASDDIQGVKGKLVLGETVKRRLLQNGKTRCEYSELSHNVLHNQIVKATIHGLISNESLDRGLRDDLLRIYRRLQGIDSINLTATAFSKVRLHRNNAFYGFLLSICQLIHSNILAKEGDGDHQFQDFIRDEGKMAGLFEAFIRNFYTRELPERDPTCRVRGSEIIDWDTTPHDERHAGYLPQMRTDISMAWPDRYLIIDTKYYKETLQTYYDRRSIHSGNLYQITAYLRNIESRGPEFRECEGMLLYPTVDAPLDLDYQMHGHRVTVKTVDLSSDWRDIHERLLAILD